MFNVKRKSVLKGYKVLSVQFSSTSSAHEIFMKEYSVQIQQDNKPLGRTLFMLNVPPWVTKESLKQTLNPYQIDLITLTKTGKEKTSTGFKSAFVVFKSGSDMQKLLSQKTLPPLSSPEYPITTGILKWIKFYNNSITTQKEREELAIEKIKKYDADLIILKKNMEEVDDEGWVHVTKNSRNLGIIRKESVHCKLNEKLNKQTKVLRNFYRHQIRQEKRDRLASLRKKIEEDKKRILAIKQRRGFKPF